MPKTVSIAVNEAVISASNPVPVSLAAAGGGTQYTEGDTDTTITGNAVMWEDASDTLRAVSATKPLPVGDAGGSLTVDGTVTAAASENVIGLVGASDTVVDLTATLDTSAYTAGDVLFDTQELTSAARVNAGIVVLQSIAILDEDDQGVALDIYFLDANTSLGTENSAPSISDTNARNILGYVSIATGDYKDLGGARIATVRSLGLQMKAGAGTTSLWVAGVTGGTPTHTASGLRFKFGFKRS